MTAARFFGVWRASRIIVSFLIIFFQKNQDKILHLKIQLTFFHPLVVTRKNSSKVKKTGQILKN